MSHEPRRRASVYTRLAIAVVLATAAATLLQAQNPTVIPARNVNMVSGRTLPDGDPFLQRQNEPSVAASTRNPLHLLAGANDYRTVDLPGLPNSKEVGDAWMGVFKSYDGGNSWRSTLIPGYPQDTARASSPLGVYQAAADPVVRAGTNGLFYYSGIVFDRDTDTTKGKSAMFVSRFIDNNNQEAGDPIVFLGTSLVATNDGTGFIDKPWFAVDIPRAGAQTCTIRTTQRSPTAADPNRTVQRTQSFPGGTAYAAYSVITTEGTQTRSQIYLSRSLNCGETWSTPLQISSSLDPINQGATLAIDPRDGTLYLAWRRFTADGTDDSIMVTRSRDRGNKWDPPGRARRFPRGKKVGLNREIHGKKFSQVVTLTDLLSLDQPTAPYQFRTNAYPTMTVDGTGRVYVAWSERGFAPRPVEDPSDGDARILIASSVDGTTWTLATPIDNAPLVGHQVMPALTFAGGRLTIAFYDFREDVSLVWSKFVDERVAVVKRHTVDVRAATAEPAVTPAFGSSVAVSEYLRGTRSGSQIVEQLQFNPPNLKLFQLGNVPFMGDYIDITPSPAFVPAAGGGWAYNTAPASSPLFHVVWSDNRDVIPPGDGDWTNYTPPGAVEGQPSFYDPTKTISGCVPAAPGSAGYPNNRAGMRNQNIYTARLTGGLVAGSPGNTKPLHPTLPRAFAVFAQNATEVQKAFRLTIQNQPVGGRASFFQEQVIGPAPASLQTTLDVFVPRRSTIARNVYAISTDPHAQIHVSVQEIEAPGADPTTGGLESTVILNPDISNPDISNPDISNPDISNPDISNPDISNAEVSNPDISNPDISNPDISNPDISNPDISNPDISNTQVANPDISNPDISNPDISNPDISNPDISNPDISNPDISNQSMSDTSWTVTNNGNTTTSYSVKLLVEDPAAVPPRSAVMLQLILHKIYKTPAVVNCSLVTHTQNVLLANITNPTFTATDAQDVNNPNVTDSSASNATLWLAPGESARITLRTRDLDTTDATTFNPATMVVPAVVPQALDVRLVDGALVVGDEVDVAVPPFAYLQFLQLPDVVAEGSPVGNVGVRLVDRTGAPVPGASVSLSVHLRPADTQVGPTLTSVVSVDGLASFQVGTLAPGTYRLRASMNMVGFTAITTWSEVFTVTPGAVQWTVASGGNGNYYEYVRVPGLSWTQARDAAAARTHNGLRGRLVTIANAQENAFVNSLGYGGPLRAWIGLYNPAGGPAAGFAWIDPQEAFTYENWADGEPNNATTEFWVEMFGDGTWNNNIHQNTQFPTFGYIVEYPAPVFLLATGGH